jgi:hypothetical protein
VPAKHHSKIARELSPKDSTITEGGGSSRTFSFSPATSSNRFLARRTFELDFAVGDALLDLPLASDNVVQSISIAGEDRAGIIGLLLISYARVPLPPGACFSLVAELLAGNLN